jgi:hypothetical protein
MMKINALNEFFGLSRYELWKSGWDNKSQVDEYSYISDQCNPEDVLLSCRIFFRFRCCGEWCFSREEL